MKLKESRYVATCPSCLHAIDKSATRTCREIAELQGGGSMVQCDKAKDLNAAWPEGRYSDASAEPLLRSPRTVVHGMTSDERQRRRQRGDWSDDRGSPVGFLDDSFGADAIGQRPTVLLVEHRDEVFARVASDITENGMRIVRVKSATGALRLYGLIEPVLVVANVYLTDQSGWLMAGKLRLIDHRVRTWLYQPKSTCYEQGLARFLQVDCLINYQGDVFALAEKVNELILQQRWSLERELCAGMEQGLAAA